jgi:hypothetical protein
MPPELSDLMNVVAERFRGEEHDQGFTIRQSVLHMAETMGLLTTECESFDHGTPMDVVALREATIRVLINTLKLANDLQMSADELAAGVGSQAQA